MGLAHGSGPECGLEGMIRGWRVTGDLHRPHGPRSLVSILIFGANQFSADLNERLPLKMELGHLFTDHSKEVLQLLFQLQNKQWNGGD